MERTKQMLDAKGMDTPNLPSLREDVEHTKQMLDAKGIETKLPSIKSQTSVRNLPSMEELDAEDEYIKRKLENLKKKRKR